MAILAKYFLAFLFMQNGTYSEGHGLSVSDKKAILEKHNEYRKELSITPLQWDEKLADYAYEWGQKLQRNCDFKHRPSSGNYKLIYGENIAMSSSEDATYAVEQWGSEKKDFHPRKMRTYRSSYLNSVGHYTQIIWEKTTRVGCARIKCKNGFYITICNYDPPGNYKDEKIF